ncbi:DUF6941 family protein [Microbacterium suaedae]|uniref:DUF6941 family protein n=1 Tax=Microbacterium suaedae TaxID=2067813 RepID=UPI000DADB774|nr:hypothetical protein [Microbacterium suaedae]
MRIAMAVAADAANVREGMMNVLSAGVTQFVREEYPARLGIDVALMIEITPEELASNGAIEARFTLVAPSGETVAAIDGEFAWAGSEAESSSYLAAPVSFRDAVVPEPGTYVIRIAVADLDEIVIKLTGHAPV